MKILTSLLAIFFALPLLALEEGDYVVILNGKQDPDVVIRQHGIGRKPKDKTWKSSVHGFSAHLTKVQADRLSRDTRVAIIEPDAVVSSIDPLAVSAQWAARYGSTSADGGHAIAVANGNVFTAGWFSLTASFSTTNLVSHGGQDLFITKVNSSGTLAWVRGYGGTGDETATSMAVDASGNIFVGGYFTGTANFGGTNMVSHGNQDIFLAKYDSNGNHLWSWQFGSTDLDSLWALAVDSTGAVTITGSFRQTISFGGATLNSILGGDTGFLAKFSASSAPVWSKAFGGTGGNLGRGLAIDSAGNSLVTGYFFGAINLGSGSLPGVGSAAAVFIGKFNSSGVLVWGKVHGDGNTVKAFAATVDSSNDLIITGEFHTQTDLGGGVVTGTAIYSDMFVAKYSSADGSWKWNQAITGNSISEAYGIAVDPSNNVLVTGYYSGTCRFGGISLTAIGGSNDSFVTKYSSGGSPLWVFSCGGPLTDIGYAVASDSTGNVYATGAFSGTGTFGSTSLVSAGSYDVYSLKLTEAVSPPPPAQVIPTGVRRIGTLNNTIANINGTDTRVNVDVAVIDTGIDLTHPDLNVFASTNFTTSASANDLNGHGTHVAGIIGALDNTIGVVGVAPGVRLWSVKVLDDTGSGSLSTIISGVEYVTAHASEIEVANMSLGAQGASDSLRLAIQNSVANGVVYVVAAGNSSFDVYGADRVLGSADDFYPAAYPEAMTVSALNDSDGLAGGLGATTTYGPDDSLGSYSNWSAEVDASNPVTSPGGAIDIAGPGTDIYSTYKAGGYTTLSGTSMASPHAAGAVALYIAAHSRATTAAGVYAIRQAIINAASPQSAWGINATVPYRNDTLPEGLLNVDSNPTSHTAPTVTVTSPTTATSYITGTVHTLIGTAIDAVDGNISAQLKWRFANSTANTFIGTGASASFTTPATAQDGYILAISTNSFGLQRAVQVPIYIYAPTFPVVQITAPINGHTYAQGDSPLRLTATATDTLDGDISAGIYWYIQNCHGTGTPCMMGIGGTITNVFVQGYYTYTALATNSASLAASNTVNFAFSDGNTTPPTISILSPLQNQVFVQGSPIRFRDTSWASTAEQICYTTVWKSSIDGIIASGDYPCVVTNSSLSLGQHVITATTTDQSVPALSSSAQVSISVVSSAPASPLAVTLTSNKAQYVKKEKATLTAHVTSSAVAVSGAVVNFVLTWNKSGNFTTVYQTLTTDSSGNAVWVFPISPQTLGSITVSATASKPPPYSDGSATTTFNVLR